MEVGVIMIRGDKSDVEGDVLGSTLHTRRHI